MYFISLFKKIIYKVCPASRKIIQLPLCSLTINITISCTASLHSPLQQASKQASKHITSINPIMSIILSFLALLFSLYFLHARLCSRRGPPAKGGTLIKGSIVLMKKRVLDLTDLRSSIVDRIYEFFGRGVSFQLVSATAVDSSKLPPVVTQILFHQSVRDVTSFSYFEKNSVYTSIQLLHILSRYFVYACMPDFTPQVA